MRNNNTAHGHWPTAQQQNKSTCLCFALVLQMLPLHSCCQSLFKAQALSVFSIVQTCTLCRRCVHTTSEAVLLDAACVGKRQYMLCKAFDVGMQAEMQVKTSCCTKAHVETCTSKGLHATLWPQQNKICCSSVSGMTGLSSCDCNVDIGQDYFSTRIAGQIKTFRQVGHLGKCR